MISPPKNKGGKNKSNGSPSPSTSKFNSSAKPSNTKELPKTQQIQRSSTEAKGSSKSTLKEGEKNQQTLKDNNKVKYVREDLNANNQSKEKQPSGGNKFGKIAGKSKTNENIEQDQQSNHTSYY